MSTILERNVPSMTLDDILQEQRRQPLLVTVEEIDDDDDRVKLTPWIAGGGCQCGLAVRVAKDVIASVEPTGEKHLCCGKAFYVVDVEFNEEATIKLHDLFEQLMTRVQGGPHDPHDDAQLPIAAPAFNMGVTPPLGYQAPQTVAPPRSLAPCGPQAWSPTLGDPRIPLQLNWRF